MADKKFEIRFDKHGNIVVDDAELQRRLKYLFATNGQIVLRMKGPEATETLPRLLNCPPSEGPIPRLAICPNAMCNCDVKVIDETIFEQQWRDLSIGPEER